MGVLNTNEDSFFQGSRFSGDAAVLHIEKMISQGAHIIDVGGVSSRPGSIGVSEDEELKRISPVVDAIYEKKLYEKACFSLDSYAPKCVEYALQRGFSIVNDITALQNDDVAKLAAKYDASVVLMHKKGSTQKMQQNPFYDDVLAEVDTFFAERIAKAKSFGIDKIILDVGIGFGKTLEHNLLLIKHHEHFLHFGYDMMVGASRKSMIDMIEPTPTAKRLPGTLALHLEAIKNGANILRVHDVAEHKQAVAVQMALKKVTL